ncbi:MAG: trypsin-like peptidase domain-containing protein [Fuerstiella sp.]|nr:trypsin-like peptidase domain-containing protein [Fuerstiella sp.]
MMRTIMNLSLMTAVLLMLPQVQADRKTLEARQKQLSATLENVSSAVVAVTDRQGFGTGVVVTGDGIVLTASHVVESHTIGQRRRDRKLEVIFPDGLVARCKQLGRNRYCDAAVLKIVSKPPDGEEFPHVPMGRSSDVKRGEWCFAMGHPGGRRKDRPAVVRFGRALSVSDQTIVSDNAIVLGDSGGPLFDLEGRVIGIHSMITRIIVENRHVAIDVWHRDWDRLLKGESWGQLRVSDNELAASEFVGIGLHWKDYQAQVTRIITNSPAAKAGFRPGDKLLKVNGRTFADRLGLTSLLARLTENQKVTVTVQRDGTEETLNVVTGLRPKPHSNSGELTQEEQEFALEFQRQIGFNRRVGQNEKRTESAMRDYAALSKTTAGSVVRFKANGKQIAFGIVMSDDGDVITKASEISRATNPVCMLPDDSPREFKKIGSNTTWDLMLVNVDADNLKPLEWSHDRPSTGWMLISPDSSGRPLLPGVVSIPPLKLPTSSQGFLGVRLDRRTRNSGVRVDRLLEGGAAGRDGIRAGDVMLSINGKPLKGVNDTVERIKGFPPNRQIEIRVLRGDTIQTVSVTLTPRFVSDQQDVLLDHYSDPKSAGKFASIHNSGFPEVIQHDTDLFPHQCGGPVLNIQGKAVGMNIARAARIISYAIPADVVQDVYESLRADTLASHQARQGGP